MYIVPTCASPANETLCIDNQRKAANPDELVQFNITVINDRHNRENFIIRHVWENSIFWLPIDVALGNDNQKVYESFGNHGTLKNFDFNENSGWVPGHSGAALRFDDENDWIQVARDTSLEPSHDMTILAWIWLDDTSGWKPIVNHTYPDGYSFDVSDDRIYFCLRQTTGFTSAYVSAGLVAGTWTQVALVLESNNEVRVYKNAEEQSFTYTNHGTGDIIYSDTPLTIGFGHIITDSYFGGVIDEVYIYNRALTDEEIRWLYNDSWSENLSNYKIELGPDENTQVTFSVKVPQGAMPSHVQKFLLTVFPQSDPKYGETETVAVEVLEHYDVAVSLDGYEKSGKPEDILTFEATVRNCGNVEDTYDISAEGGEEWGLSLSPGTITIPPGAVGTSTISVTVPSEACPGDYTSFEIQATSHGNPSLVVQVGGTAIATAIYDFSITAHSELEQGSPGSEVTILLELRNLGTAPDTFDLEVKSAVGWDVEVDPSSLSLENGETGKVAVRVRVPEDALIGQMGRMTIQAVSRGDPRVSTESSISVQAVTPFWERPDVRFLVGLIIGALVGATLIGSIILRRAPIIRRSRKS